MVFEPIFDSAYDHNGRLDIRLIDHDLLETPLERLVRFDMFSIFVKRRRTDDFQFATYQVGLQDVRGVHRTWRATGTDQRMNFIDEENNIRHADNFCNYLLVTLL